MWLFHLVYWQHLVPQYTKLHACQIMSNCLCEWIWSKPSVIEPIQVGRVEVRSLKMRSSHSLQKGSELPIFIWFVCYVCGRRSVLWMNSQSPLNLSALEKDWTTCNLLMLRHLSTLSSLDHRHLKSSSICTSSKFLTPSRAQCLPIYVCKPCGFSPLTSMTTIPVPCLNCQQQSLWATTSCKVQVVHIFLWWLTEIPRYVFDVGVSQMQVKICCNQIHA